MTDSERPKRKSWRWLHWGVVIVVGLLGLGLAMPTVDIMADMANQTSGSNNARQIVMAMKIWANDHEGFYVDSKHPELRTANQVFRQLFVEDIIEDERLFGGHVSPFVPDGRIGQAPGFEDAVAAGENHWVFVAGQVPLKTPGHHPLVLENSVDANWPPRWKSGAEEKPVRGRTWKKGRIIVGFNDNSVEIVALKKSEGFLTLPDRVLKPEGKSPVPVLKVLDIEERPATGVTK